MWDIVATVDPIDRVVSTGVALLLSGSRSVDQVPDARQRVSDASLRFDLEKLLQHTHLKDYHRSKGKNSPVCSLSMQS